MRISAETAVTPNPLKSRHLRYCLYAGAAVLVMLLCVVGTARLRGWWIFRRPVVRVAFNQFPPYVDRQPNGTPVGFAAEIFAEAARRANVEIRWVEIPAAAEDAFDHDKADMYPLMTVTAEREKRYHMSAPWWVNQFALFSTEGRAIRDAAGAKGKTIASRAGVIQNLSRKLYPGARVVNMYTLPEMEEALCAQKIDGFFADVRLLETQLMTRTASCAGQALHITRIPGSQQLLGTASTKAKGAINDRIFREIAKLALDGTLSRTAAAYGVFTPYDSAQLKQVVDAEGRAKQMAWALAATLFVLVLSIIQTARVRREKRRAESARMDAQEMHDWFDEFMRHTPTITYIKDREKRVVYSNEEFCCRNGPFALTAQAGAISERLTDQDEEVLEYGRGVEVMETLHYPDGASRHFLVLKFPFQGVAGASFLGGVALDVTARIQAEKELELHARRDLLTGLPNRRSFMQELGEAIETSSILKQQLVVGFMDLDGFKAVNDRLGHEAGDELLKAVAERLQRACRESDMVARLGGDEFTFFLPSVAANEAKQIVSRALRLVEAPFRILGEDISVSASVGLSVFPEHGSSSQQLLRNADFAMYLAKRNGKKRIEFWSRDLDQPAENRENALAALAGNPAL